MSKNMLLTLFCSLYFFKNIHAQNTVIDSLENILRNHKKNDFIKVDLLNELTSELYITNVKKADSVINVTTQLLNKLDYTYGKARLTYYKGRVTSKKYDYKGAIVYFEEAIKTFKSIHKKKDIADCYSGIARNNFMQGDSDKAILFEKKSLAINEEIDYTDGISRSLNNIGAINSIRGNYEEAITYFKKALEYRIKTNNLRGIASTCNNIGSIYAGQGNSPKALEYFYKSLEFYDKINDNIKRRNTINNIGTIYQDQENFNEALTYYEKGLSVSQSNEDKIGIAKSLSHIGSIYCDLSEEVKALGFYTKALKINHEIKNKSSIATNLNNISTVQLTLKKPNEALKNAKKALTTGKEIKKEINILNSNLVIAKIYEQQQKYATALNYALDGQRIAKKLKSLIKQKEASELLFKIYKNIGNYKKALVSHEQFKTLNDSLFNKKNIEKITQLEYEYKYKHEIDAANIRELKLTKTVKSTSQDLEKSQRNLLLGVIAFLIISLILGTTILFLKLRNETSKTQNILIEQKLLRSQMTPHFIFNSLSVLQGMILNKEEKSSITYLSKFSKLLRTILENSRHKTVSLSDELFAINSYMALQNLDVTPPYDYSLIIAEAIDQEAIKIPPMLIQPFIENAIEHAFPNKKEAKKIDVHLVLKDEKLICTISDNGIGINTEQQKNDNNKNSLATTITSERLKMLSKDFKIQGSVTIKNKALFGKQGTLVTLVIPYKIAKSEIV